MKQVIAVDIDDVLADSTEALRLVVNDTYDLNISASEYRVPGPYWQYYEHVWENNGVAGQVSHKALEQNMVHDQNHIQPVKGALEAIKQLASKYDIVLVTARDQSWADATTAWLDFHFAGIYSDFHILGNHKTRKDPRSKGEVCKEIGASYLIDDNPEHCLSALEYGLEAILFGEYGWHFAAPEHLVRCSNWQEVVRFFDEQRTA